MKVFAKEGDDLAKATAAATMLPNFGTPLPRLTATGGILAPWRGRPAMADYADIIRKTGDKARDVI